MDPYSGCPSVKKGSKKNESLTYLFFFKASLNELFMKMICSETVIFC